MYVDSHVHLQPHGEKPVMTRERLERYVEAGRAAGVERLAFTEHLFRFHEALALLRDWWDDDGDPVLAAATHKYLEDEVSASIAEYVRLIEEAKADGLPVLLGLEMDWVPGREKELRAFLAPYDWDIVLGSVHWIGAWGFDSASIPAFAAEWERRDVDAVFADYAQLVRDLADSKLADVLAHPDLPKIQGHRPSNQTPLHAAIVEAASRGGCAVEINSNGYNKPVREAYPHIDVLRRAHEAGLAITLASDAHQPERVGERFDDLASLAREAGYEQFASFEARRATFHPLPEPSRS
ncbi:MAG: histidinol-phosphatase HisJ family protein [Dehalococcoidia bacterium]